VRYREHLKTSVFRSNFSCRLPLKNARFVPHRGRNCKAAPKLTEFCKRPKDYALSWNGKGKKVFKVGIVFDKEQRNIGGWETAEV
jgi:hypothetical protein